MRAHPTLIASPLQWQTRAVPVPHPAILLIAERGGTQFRTPRPVILVDTREQTPFDFSRFEGWSAGIEKRPLKVGDYLLHCGTRGPLVERKNFADLIHSLTTERSVFVGRLRLMSRYSNRLLVVTAALSDVKSSPTCIGANPNRVTRSQEY
jgi:ERCC4-type nuclease